MDDRENTIENTTDRQQDREIEKSEIQDTTGEPSENNTIDTAAFADLISEKDKELTELRNELNKIKKSNAELLLRINAEQHQQKDISQTILDFCDTRKIK